MQWEVFIQIGVAVQSMPSITNYTETLKPYNGIGMRGYMAGPMLFLLLVLFLGDQIREEYCRFLEHQQMTQAEMWPSAIAKVAKISSTPRRVSDGRSSYHTEYYVTVEYAYKVNGKQNYAKQENFLNYPYRRSATSMSYRMEDEKRLEAEYQENSTHTVRYEPGKPGVAYIDVQVTPDGPGDQQRRSFIIGAFIIGALVVGLFSSGITKMR